MLSVKTAFLFALVQTNACYGWPAGNYSRSADSYGIGALDDEVDWSEHPCKRECRDNAEPMSCRYGFTIENYATMSRACYGCPRNAADCFRPHCVAGDGNKYRMALVVNRQLPGPSIEVCKGDRIVVDVKNKLNGESTTIHWHGIHMRGTPFMDGVPMISQCPIEADDSFRYDFKAERAGTFWWHSHVGLQRSDGLFGALIVRPPPSQNQVGHLYERDEHAIMLNEWTTLIGGDSYYLLYHTTAGVVTPHAIFINGLGRSGINANSAMMPRRVFRVRKGSRHRFRVINAGGYHCAFTLTIDRHPLLVVSADGADVEAVEVDAIRLLPAERYDFVVEADRPVGNYWIRVSGSVNCATKKLHQEAILRYEGAPDEEPSEATGFTLGFEAAKKVLNPSTLANRVDPAAMCVSCSLSSLEPDDLSLVPKPHQRFYLRLGYYPLPSPEYYRKNLYDLGQVPVSGFASQINHLTFKVPSSPLQTQPELVGPNYLCNVTEARCTREQCACPHGLKLKLNSTVEFVFVDDNKSPQEMSHPMHLHGFYFRVVAMGQILNMSSPGDVRAWDRAGKIQRRLKAAPMKDVIDVPSSGYAVIRIRADNPGYWFVHCHFERHLHNGMALVLKVGEHKDFPPTPKDFPKCHHKA